MELVREEDFLDGPVIAVNLSIRFLAQGIPIDIWAVVDHPDLLWEWAKPYQMLNPKLEFFVVDNHVKPWADLVDPTRLYSLDTPFIGEERQPDGKRTLLPTLHACLAWLWKQEYTHVRLFGCDMQGTGSQGHFTPSEAWKAEESEGYKLRWFAERTALAQCMRLFRKKGWRLQRFYKSPR